MITCFRKLSQVRETGVQEAWVLNSVAGGGFIDRQQRSKGLKRLCGCLGERVTGRGKSQAKAQERSMPDVFRLSIDSSNLLYFFFLQLIKMHRSLQ